MVEFIKLKHKPEEFCVVENLSKPYTSSKGCKYHYYNLLKVGYSTFDAISEIANYFGVANDDINYAGLKDEDGITEQTVAVNIELPYEKLNSFNNRYYNFQERIHLTLSGTGDYPIGIGCLNGNGFYVTVRNIPQKIEDRLTLGNNLVHFLNYYDIQRFGVPNSKKCTHLIGESLINKDYKNAFRLIKENGTIDSVLAKSFVGSEKDFFNTLDRRKISFFKCAHGSYKWNKKLFELLIKCSQNNHLLETKIEGIPYLYTCDVDSIIKVLKHSCFLPYDKYVVNENKDIVPASSQRPTVIQTNVYIDSIEEDDVYEGKYKINMSFFLPKGSYATNMIKQLIIQSLYS